MLLLFIVIIILVEEVSTFLLSIDFHLDFQNYFQNKKYKWYYKNKARMAQTSNSIPDGIVVFANEPVVVPSGSLQQKAKKPKHLKRKLAVAVTEVELAELEKQREELAKIKDEAAASFKKKVRKLVLKMHGDEAWDPEKYDQLIAGGVVGSRLLKKLNITREQQKVFDAEVKVEKMKMITKKRRRDERNSDSESDSSDSDDSDES